MAPMAVPTAAQSSNVNRSRGRAWPSRWTAIITVVSPVGPGLRGVSGVDSAWVCCPTACAVAVWPGRGNVSRGERDHTVHIEAEATRLARGCQCLRRFHTANQTRTPFLGISGVYVVQLA